MSDIQHGQGLEDLYKLEFAQKGTFWGFVDSCWLVIQRVSAILAIIMFVVAILQLVRGNTMIMGPSARMGHSEPFRRRRL